MRRDLKGVRYVQKISKDKHVIIQMDTTYWGRGFGLMVIKDALRKKILWWKYVHHEIIASFSMQCVEHIAAQRIANVRVQKPENAPFVPSIIR